MALSDDFVRRHISHWQDTLRGTYYAHRQHWPANLFHHSALENAVEILREGCLRSRNDPHLRLGRDVAAAAVLANRDAAHNFVRMYFRPKTPTQYHIEGIRRPGECQYGDASHAPVLIMFVLDAQKIITKPGIRVSNQNMQRDAAVTGDTEEHFDSIPFDKVYHEGPTGGDGQIKYYRCAEVLSPSPLMLREVLTGVWFRSIPERDTLIHMLGDAADAWVQYFQVSDGPKVFQKDYPYFEKLNLSADGIIFQINPRRDYAKLKVKIVARHSETGAEVKFFNPEIDATSAGGGDWIYRAPIPDGEYMISAYIDDHLAYCATQSIDNSIF